ncbi:DUF397 domain-containing protein [Streptomyces sp. SID8364]|nr:DUF397 domain-containing protein [Streptomyces sp. SID8364]
MHRASEIRCTECVQVANQSATVGVRDSTRLAGPPISVSHAAWAQFVAGMGMRRL